MTSNAKFWDGIAEKYARDPIKDMKSYEYTLERTRSYLGKSDKVLELGAGTASTALLLADSAGQITASDLSDGMLNVGRRNAKAQGVGNIDFLCSDAMVAEVAPGSFDVVMAFNLLHLVPDLDAVLARAHEVLNPGGLLISKTPCLDDSNIFARGAFRVMIPVMQLFGKAPFVRYMTSDYLERRITRAGFTIIERVNLPGKVGRPYYVARRD
ncbi:class I SAM-dependent methyltransferase [Shimia biformata]|uniref:class I SAM-dependent methyltransferase n=1 Tax=Shimia biformata TaxID=1294299 RepID=UPI0019509675|nr:class I SAM-dependent methyltransferase [Shimia biformata]